SGLVLGSNCGVRRLFQEPLGPGAIRALQQKTAFSRFPPVHRVDPEGQQRVDRGCLTDRWARGPSVRLAPVTRRGALTAAARADRRRPYRPAQKSIIPVVEGRFGQASAWAVESTWSSWRPAGKSASSLK